MNHTRALRYAAVALSAGIVLAGCTVDGAPQRGPLDLDTGNFATSPSPDIELTEGGKRRISGIRLGEAMVMRTEIDSDITRPSMQNFPLSGVNNLDALEYMSATFSLDDDKPTKNASDQPSSKNFRFGYVNSGSAAGDGESTKKFLQFALIAYDSDRSAEAALTELIDVARTNMAVRREEVRPIAGLPAGSESATGTDEYGNIGAIGLLRKGRMLVFASGLSQVRGWSVDAVRKAIDVQAASMPSEEGLEDPRSDEDEKLLAATLPIVGRDERFATEDHVVGPRVRSHLFYDGPQALEMFTAAGVKRASTRETEVYEAGDEKKAQELQAAFVALAKDGGQRAAASPRDLSSADCLEDDDDFTCFVTAGRYVVVADGESLVEAQQKVSAQYLLLKD